MQAAFGIKLATILAVMAAGCLPAEAQAPGVPLCTQAGQESQYKARLLNAAKDLYTKGDALKMDQARKQLTRILVPVGAAGSQHEEVAGPANLRRGPPQSFAASAGCICATSAASGT